MSFKSKLHYFLTANKDFSFAWLCDNLPAELSPVDSFNLLRHHKQEQCTIIKWKSLKSQRNSQVQFRDIFSCVDNRRLFNTPCGQRLWWPDIFMRGKRRFINKSSEQDVFPHVSGLLLLKVGECFHVLHTFFLNCLLNVLSELWGNFRYQDHWILRNHVLASV